MRSRRPVHLSLITSVLTRFAATAVVATAALLPAACKPTKPTTTETDAGVATSTPMAAPTTAQPNVIPTVLDLVSNLHRCEIRHLGGELLDLGSPATEGREAWRLGPNPDIASIEKEGATWARIQARSVSYVFSWGELSPLVFRARARALSARSVSVFLDGKPFGTIWPTQRHQQDRFDGANRRARGTRASHDHAAIPRVEQAAAEPLAELDWIHLGPPLDEGKSFAAPTQRDVIQSIATNQVPHRSLTLRAPGSIRCPLGVPVGASPARRGSTGAR
ncbi:MAG: hypothetical protein U0165_14685 [Polyangiaceae bacterium]